MTYESDNTDKLFVLVNELKRMGIKILKPNLNKSYNYFAIEKVNDREKSIRYSYIPEKMGKPWKIRNVVVVGGTHPKVKG